jgi:hypothetical protein
MLTCYSEVAAEDDARNEAHLKKVVEGELRVKRRGVDFFSDDEDDEDGKPRRLSKKQRRKRKLDGVDGLDKLGTCCVAEHDFILMPCRGRSECLSSSI